MVLFVDLSNMNLGLGLKPFYERKCISEGGEATLKAGW